MKWVLLFVLFVIGAIIVTMSTLVLFVRHRLHRLHRIEPSTSTGAPLYWLLSPQVAARLHRRLVAAGRTAQLVAERHRPSGRRARRQEPPTIVGLCADLQAQAVSLDQHLPMVGRLPASQRRSVLARLTIGVAEVERGAARLSVMSAEISAPRVLPHEDDDEVELSRRLDSLEAANQELRAIEADCGLTSMPLFGDPTERQPAGARPSEPPPVTRREGVG